MTLTDPGARGYPLVRGFHSAFEVVIGHYLRRQVVTCAKNARSGSLNALALHGNAYACASVLPVSSILRPL